MEQHVRIKDEQDRGHGAALAEAPGSEVVVGCDIVDKGGVPGVGVESTNQVNQPRRHSIVVEDPTEGGVGNAVKGLVKIYVKIVGLGASGLIGAGPRTYIWVHNIKLGAGSLWA